LALTEDYWQYSTVATSTESDTAIPFGKCPEAVPYPPASTPLLNLLKKSLDNDLLVVFMTISHKNKYRSFSEKSKKERPHAEQKNGTEKSNVGSRSQRYS
jgi:hypothetical protein